MLQALCVGGAGPFAFSTDHGVTHIASTTFFDWALDASKQAGIDDFQAKRVRSAIETALAALDVTLEVRGRLQSHGVSGVQQRHYDKHSYLAQKAKVLTLLRRDVLLEPVT
jgi:hypothetical protein